MNAHFSISDLLGHLKSTVMALALFVTGALVLLGAKGCLPPLTPAELEAAYTAELTNCVVRAQSRAEAKSCRDEVNTRYGVCETAGEWPRFAPCDAGTDSGGDK